jgi:hypothetical protein
MQRSEVLPADIAAHLRAAALGPLTDDAAARIAVGSIVEHFVRDLEASWRHHRA